MSLPTSDLHNPTVCLGNPRLMQCLSNGKSPLQFKQYSSSTAIEMTTEFASNTISNSSKTFACNSNGNQSHSNHQQHHHHHHEQLQQQSQNNSNNNLLNNKNASGDLASFDSSDTYASCQTHPFLSQGDLTGDMADISCMLDELDMDDLYFTSLDQRRRPTNVSSTFTTAIDMTSREMPSSSAHVKKSASGEAGLLCLAAAPMDEVYQTFQSFEMASRDECGSNASLNDPSLPKHRKTRFQQSSFNKGKAVTKKLSHDSLDVAMTTPVASTSATGLKRLRRPSFMPPKSLVSATKLINQHLFGIQYSSTKSKCSPSNRVAVFNTFF